MRTLKVAIASALACGAIQLFTTVGAGASNGDKVTSALQQLGSIETASSTQIFDLYKALEGDGPVTGTERSDVLASFNNELAQAVDSIADVKEAEAKQIALGKEDPKAAATVAAKDSDALSSLIDVLTSEENAAKARLERAQIEHRRDLDCPDVRDADDDEPVVSARRDDHFLHQCRKLVDSIDGAQRKGMTLILFGRQLWAARQWEVLLQYPGEVDGVRGSDVVVVPVDEVLPDHRRAGGSAEPRRQIDIAGPRTGDGGSLRPKERDLPGGCGAAAGLDRIGVEGQAVGWALREDGNVPDDDDVLSGYPEQREGLFQPVPPLGVRVELVVDVGAELLGDDDEIGPDLPDAV